MRYAEDRGGWSWVLLLCDLAVELGSRAREGGDEGDLRVCASQPLGLWDKQTCSIHGVLTDPPCCMNNRHSLGRMATTS